MTNNPNLYSQTATADTATISAIRMVLIFLIVD